MQKNTSILLLGILGCACLFMGFQNTDRAAAIQQLINKEVERRVEEYRKIKMKRCEEKIMDAADRRADSIIIARSRDLKILQDSIARPIAPGRPLVPELLEPIDSSLPAPLLRDEEDTLGQG